MYEHSHDSPESAAMTGFPDAHCRVVSSRVLADDAYVLLDTGSPGQPYLYGVNCHRKDGQWFEGASSNGPGWEQTAHDPDLGTLSWWGDAPAGADFIRVAFEGTVIDVLHVLVKFNVVTANEMIHQFRDVISAIAQGREFDRD